MLVVSLFVSIQQSVERFQTRKKLASLTAQQMKDIGMTKERYQTELSRATMVGVVRDVLLLIKNGGRMS
jgi:uncharacterized protein YjiS (DUF1127 family)